MAAVLVAAAHPLPRRSPGRAHPALCRSPGAAADRSQGPRRGKQLRTLLASGRAEGARLRRSCLAAALARARRGDRHVPRGRRAPPICTRASNRPITLARSLIAMTQPNSTLRPPGAADFGLLLLLALTWGSSFWFIKWAVPTVPPLSLAVGRIAIGAALLLMIAHAKR